MRTDATLWLTTPNISFVLWSRKRSATMLDPFAQLFQHCWGRTRSLRMVYKDLWVVSFPRCTTGPNIVESCCIRLHTTANTHATTPNIVGATMLGVVASVCTQPNVTENAVQRISYARSPTASILGNLDDNIKQQLPSGKHSHGSLERDLNELIIRAFEFKIFSEVELQNIQRLPERQTCQFGHV